MENQTGAWWKLANIVRDEYYQIAHEKNDCKSIIRYNVSFVPLVAKRLGITQKNVRRSLAIYNAGNPVEEIECLELRYIEPPKIKQEVQN